MKFTSLAIIAVFAASPAFAASKPSQTFLKKAIEGNYAEIEMGKLAQQNGQSPDVKKYGQMLTDDHSAANQKAMDAAKSLGMTPPNGPSAKQKAEYDKMSKMTGARVDALRRNEFEQAWELSDRSLGEYRLSGAIKYAGERHFQRIWQGEDLTKKSVLVRCYHGLGDTIQFVRFAKPLREIAREVIIWSQPELLPLVREVEGVDHVLPLHDGTPDASFDVDIEVMELAHA